jgi:hypothetical protein
MAGFVKEPEVVSEASAAELDEDVPAEAKDAAAP